MKISLSDLGKRFNREWIFRHLQEELDAMHPVAIIGANGSGKSTLLQLLAGISLPSEGKIIYTLKEKQIETHNLFPLVSFSAPYLEVPEELSLKELLSFHFQFKQVLPSYSIKKIIDTIGLVKSADKQIRYYSSGMKQRVRLALALFSDTPLLLLDEPCSNLDRQGISWYQEQLRTLTSNRLVIISSNDPQEYINCTKQIAITDYKSDPSSIL